MTTTSYTVIEACACRGNGCTSCDQSGMRAVEYATPEEHTVEHAACSGFGCADCGMRGYDVADLVFTTIDANTDRLEAVSEAGMDWMASAYWSYGPNERRPVIFRGDMMIASGQREWIAQRSGLVIEVSS